MKLQSTTRLPINTGLNSAKNPLLEFNQSMCYHVIMMKSTASTERIQNVQCRISSGEDALAMEMKFSQNLAKYRKKAGLTQSQLASVLMVTPQAVSKWEKGSYPDSELLPDLASALGVSLDALFGLREEDGSVDMNKAAAEKIQKLPPEDKGKFIMEQFYSMLSAFNSNTAPGNIRYPETFKCETFAHLRTNYELGLARLNPDMQYACFMRIPENGINTYFSIQPRILELFSILADENALRIISYAETFGRNFIITKECISKKLGLPMDVVSDIVEHLVRFGIMWELTADTGDANFPIYGYVHNVPLVGIMTLAESISHFLSCCEPDIDIWTKAPFRAD